MENVPIKWGTFFMRQDRVYWLFIFCLLAVVALFTILSNPSSANDIDTVFSQRNFLPLLYKQPTPSSTPTPTKTPIPTKTPTPLPSPTPVVETPVGPIGGTFTSLVVDPNQDDNIYAGHFQSGVYKSYDKGWSWYRKSKGLAVLNIQSLASHPTNSNIVYAGTYKGGIYKTMNAAESWFPINTGLSGIDIVYDIEIDVNNPNVIYIATRREGSLMGYVYRSINSGANWTLIYTGDHFDTPDYFYDIDVNPLNSNELYLTAHEHGFYKSTNAGANFFAINNGVYSDYSARSLALDPAYPGLIYAGTWHGEAIYRSWNGGSSWVNARSGIPSDAKVFRTYLDPFGRNQKRVFACTYGNGLYTSDDFAQSWVPRGLAGQRIYDFLVTDGSTQRWYAATESNGIFRSANYGSGWVGVMGDLSLNPISSYLYYPAQDRQLAAVFGMGIYALDQNGLNWQEFAPALEDKQVLDLASDGDELYALTEQAFYEFDGSEWEKIDLPVSENKLDQNWLGRYGDEVGLSMEMVQPRFEEQFVSVDGQEVNQVIPRSIKMIDGRLYLLSHGSGAYLRVEKNWELIGITEGQVLDLAKNPENELLYASVCSIDNDCQLLAFDGSAWQAQDSKIGRIRINSFYVIEDHLFAAAENGIYRWVPGVEDWELKMQTEQDVLSMTQFGESCRLAAGGVGQYFISSDCGDTWIGYQTEEPWHYQTLIFLPIDPERLLVGSREAGADIFTIP